MTRMSDHHFTMPEAPVFGFEDPFYDAEERCVVCGEPISSCQLCPSCAAGNDPFVQSKYSTERNH